MAKPQAAQWKNVVLEYWRSGDFSLIKISITGFQVVITSLTRRISSVSQRRIQDTGLCRLYPLLQTLESFVDSAASLVEDRTVKNENILTMYFQMRNMWRLQQRLPNHTVIEDTVGFEVSSVQIDYDKTLQISRD